MPLSAVLVTKHAVERYEYWRDLRHEYLGEQPMPSVLSSEEQIGLMALLAGEAADMPEYVVRSRKYRHNGVDVLYLENDTYRIVCHWDCLALTVFTVEPNTAHEDPRRWAGVPPALTHTVIHTWPIHVLTGGVIKVGRRRRPINGAQSKEEARC